MTAPVVDLSAFRALRHVVAFSARTQPGAVLVEADDAEFWFEPEAALVLADALERHGARLAVTRNLRQMALNAQAIARRAAS